MDEDMARVKIVGKVLRVIKDLYIYVYTYKNNQLQRSVFANCLCATTKKRCPTRDEKLLKKRNSHRFYTVAISHKKQKTKNKKIKKKERLKNQTLGFLNYMLRTNICQRFLKN